MEVERLRALELAGFASKKKSEMGSPVESSHISPFEDYGLDSGNADGEADEAANGHDGSYGSRSPRSRATSPNEMSTTESPLGDCEERPVSPGTLSSKGSHTRGKFRKKSKSPKSKRRASQKDASDDEVQDRWDFASWKAMPAVARYEDLRYKAHGPPRPIFRYWLDENAEMLPMMHLVRKKQALG